MKVQRTLFLEAWNYSRILYRRKGLCFQLPVVILTEKFQLWLFIIILTFLMSLKTAILMTNCFFMNFLLILQMNQLSNNYGEITHILSHTFRFIENCKKDIRKYSGPLTANELKTSEIFVLKQVQSQHFSNHIRSLMKKEELSKDNQLQKCKYYNMQKQILQMLKVNFSCKSTNLQTYLYLKVGINGVQSQNCVIFTEMPTFKDSFQQ